METGGVIAKATTLSVTNKDDDDEHSTDNDKSKPLTILNIISISVSQVKDTVDIKPIQDITRHTATLT